MRKCSAGLAVVVAGLLGAPAGAGAACDPDEVEAAGERPGGPSTAIVLTCRGERVGVVRRPRGATIGIVVQSGREVAWAETGAMTRVLRARLPGLRRPQVVARTSRRVTSLVVTDRREVAWAVEGRLSLRIPGEARRVLDEGPMSELAVEDGRTLRWANRRGEYLYEDLPRDYEPGCPERGSFRPVAFSPGLVVSRADYRDLKAFERGPIVVRACFTAFGTDRVIAQAPEVRAGTGEELDVDGAANGWVVLNFGPASRRQRRVEVVDAGGSRRGRTATFDWPCPGDRMLDWRLRDDAPVAVSLAGAPGWIARCGGTDRLLAIDGDGRLVELDRGAEGSISGLFGDALGLHWTGPSGPRDAAL